jgi:hypothetical protein
MIASDILDPGRLARQRQVDIAHDQGRLATGGGEDQGLRAVDADPGIVSANVKEMLGSDADAEVDAMRAQDFTRPRQSFAVLGYAEGGIGRAHHDAP